MNIGGNIKKIREFRNYTQEYIATELGIRRQTYIKMESGETDVKFESLKQIAKILDVNINDIISYDDKMIFNNCTNSHFGFNYHTISGDEKTMYEKLLSDKDERIKFLEAIIIKQNLV
jgi:transcriptional regulator with XRE-family HTH domain